MANDEAAAPGAETPRGQDGARRHTTALSPGDIPSYPWHAVQNPDVLDAFRSGAHGLSAEEAAERYLVFGPNLMPAEAPRSATMRLLSQFHNLLIYTLIAAAAVSILLGHLVDAGVILAVVILNAVIGFIQEGRAERSLDAIRRMIDPKASVIRGGHRTTIPAGEVVPGDIVFIEAGDRVPADTRLLRCRGLRIDEAVLTGESMPVEKSPDPVPEEVPLGDRTSMAFSGTLITGGQGTGVAVATGVTTELGRISTLVADVETLKTPLLRQMDGFARQLTFAILALSLVTFLFAFLVRDYTAADAFMMVVGLAVAAIPEGLPAIMTITLAIGVQRMARRNAIIRRLPAVETLGSVSVICSDKTGTLTRNEMVAQAIMTADAAYDVTGEGYGPNGAIRTADREVEAEDDPVLTEVIRAALLCNDADLSQAGNRWRVNGDPMEGALVTLAMKAGFDPTLARKQLPRVDEIPFDSAHRFMATLHRRHEDGAFILMKGAPERIVDMCSRERTSGGDRPIDAEAWQVRANELAARGQRVLAFAAKKAASQKSMLSFGDVENGAVLLGIVGFIDPPREEAVAAVADCKAAGVRPVMITGDHGVTAREIARQLGLADEPKVLTGEELDRLDEAGLRASAKETSVFARTSPEHKLRLVEALQADGSVIAMTGDGVNDAPALKRADVGVAMGRNGSEAAKEASEMVLADDNFASIVAAVREGRTVYDNLMKTVAWTLPTNGGESLTILAAIAFGLTLPMTPVQILWINMVTAAALGITLAFEPTEPGTMRRPPRQVGAPILSGDLLWRVVFVSLLFVVGAFGIFYWAEARGLSIETARTMVVNTIVVMEIFYLFSVRYVHGTSLTIVGVVGTPAVLVGIGAVVIAQLGFTYLPFMHALFETRAVALLDGLVIVAVGVVLLLVVEVEKRIRAAIAGRYQTSPSAGRQPDS